MLKIGSCTILYNPDEKVIKNIETYSNLVDYCVIVDNSDKKNDICNSLKNNNKYIYIDMEGNKGIAAALNKGINFLRTKKIDYALTMDQDSQFPSECYDKIIEIINNNKDNYSVIGLNFNNMLDYECTEIIDVPYWLTSGNFVNINDFFKLGKFNNDLFIDYVDIEYGHKLYIAGLKIGYLKGFSLIHQIGNPIKIKLFGKTYYSMNHSPIRYYYRYRNSYFLYHKDKKFYKEKFLKEIFINIPKMLLCEKNKKKKLMMIHKGITDAKEGKLGKFDENDI